jgi:hypothetical protein
MHFRDIETYLGYILEVFKLPELDFAKQRHGIYDRVFKNTHFTVKEKTSFDPSCGVKAG